MKKNRVVLYAYVLQLALGLISAKCEAVTPPDPFVTTFSSYTELENPNTGFANGRTIIAHVFVPASPHADMPLVVMNHGSGGTYGSINDLADGNFTEVADEWAALLTRMGYVAVLLDGYTSRGFVEDNKLITCHTPSGNSVSNSNCTPAQLAAGNLDQSSYRYPGEGLVTNTDCGNPCVSNTQQRAYDMNYAADHFASPTFQSQLQNAVVPGTSVSVDPSRFYVFGHSDGGITTLAGMFRGHADGMNLPSRGAAIDAAYPRAGRYAAAVSFYPGCSMQGAYEDDSGDSLYYPYAPLLILHANADNLYRSGTGETAGSCEARIAASRPLMQAAGVDIPFEMVVYTAKGRVGGSGRPGIRHGFDRAYWNDAQDLDWLVPEHMSKVHADAVMLKFFSLHPDPTGNNLSASSLRAGAIPYQAYYYPSLPPTWMKNPAENIVVNPAVVPVVLPDFVQNPYFYDVPGNPDSTLETVPGDFAITYAVTGLPAGLSFNALNYSITGSLPVSASTFWVVAENNGGRYRQQLSLQPDGQLQLGPGYRVDTANGVMRESGLINVDLGLYLSAVPSGSAVHWNLASLPTGVTAIDSNIISVDPNAFTLPATFAMDLSVDGLTVSETLVVEQVIRPGYPTFNRVRFQSSYLAPGSYPSQNYHGTSPMSGDGYGYDPNDGGVPPPNVGLPWGLPPGEGIFVDGFEGS